MKIKMSRFGQFKNVVVIFFFTISLYGAESTKIKIFNLPNGVSFILNKKKDTNNISFFSYHKHRISEENYQKTFATYMLKDLMFGKTIKGEPYESYFAAKKVGGYCGAEVRPDCLIYFQILPKSRISQALWYENERLTGLTFQTKFIKNIIYNNQVDVERKLKNSYIKMRTWIQNKMFNVYKYKNNFLSLFVDKKKIPSYIYPELLKEIYEDVCSPQKLIVVITGNFDNIKIKKLLQKYYGKLKNKGSQNKSYILNPYKKVKSFDLANKNNIQNFSKQLFFKKNRAFLAFKLPGIFSKDFLGVKLLIIYLIDQRVGYLAKTLPKDVLSDFVYKYSFSNYVEENILFIDMASKKTSNLIKGKKRLLRLLNEMKFKRVPLKKLEQLKTIAKLEHRYMMADPLSESLFLARNYDFHRTLNYVNNYEQLIKKITAQDLIAIAKKYFSTNNKVYVNVLTK